MNTIFNSSTTANKSDETSGVFVRGARPVDVDSDFLMGLAERSYDEALGELDKDIIDGSDSEEHRSPVVCALMQLSEKFRNASHKAMETELAEPFELTVVLVRAA